MMTGSVISDMHRNVPPHRGQTVTSNSKARLSRCAQVSRVGSGGCGRVGRLGGFERSGLWVRFFRGLPGTSLARNLLFGANNIAQNLRDVGTEALTEED